MTDSTTGRTFVGFSRHDLHQSKLHQVCTCFSSMAHQSNILLRPLRQVHWLIPWSGNQRLYLNLSTCFVCNVIKLGTQLWTFTIYFLCIRDLHRRTFAFHASGNTLQLRFTKQLFIKSRFTEHKTCIVASQKYPCPPLSRIHGLRFAFGCLVSYQTAFKIHRMLPQVTYILNVFKISMVVGTPTFPLLQAFPSYKLPALNRAFDALMHLLTPIGHAQYSNM